MRAALALLATSLLGFCNAANDYPIVFWHGFLGWGRDELLGVKYWGALTGDAESELKKAGYGDVYTVAVGPVSSNWDRVCEAFAQIKGTRVDYGKIHSATYNHNRFGRDFTGKGLYPQWGETDQQTGMVNKIHLIAHSMGGVDARMLDHLLNAGKSGEGDGGNSNAQENLFAGGKNWIHSITTLSTPHDGTTLALVINSFADLVLDLVGGIVTLVGGEIGGNNDPLYDFKLDQFNLEKQDGQSLTEYMKAVTSSSIFDPGFKDTALWSLSPDGTLETNNWVKCWDNTYYFSYATQATYRVPFFGNHLAEWHQLIIFWPFSALLGNYQRRTSASNKVDIDKDWYASDGVVNTVSMKGPTTGNSGCTVRNYDRNQLASSKGKWLYMGKKDGWDHLDITGLGERFSVQSFYREIASLVKSLRADNPLPGDWPVAQKSEYKEEATIEELQAMLAVILDPDNGNITDEEKCKVINDVCLADMSAETKAKIGETCDQLVKDNDCDASPASTTAPYAFAMVAATFVGLLW